MKTVLVILCVLVAYVVYAALTVVLAREVGREAVARAVPYQKTEGAKRGLVVGDSTAVGVGVSMPEKSVAGLLAAEFPHMSVENRAVSGAKLADVIAQLASTDGTYDLVLIHAGANDVLYFSSKQTIKDGVVHLFKEGQKKSKNVVVLTAGNIGLAPVLPWPLGYVMTVRTKYLRMLMMAEAEKTGAHYIDLYKERGQDPFEHDIAHYYAPDGLHLSDQGYAHWYSEIRRQVRILDF